jgi:hypothetical protein
MRDSVVVKWKMRGMAFENGYAEPRAPGDEDIMTLKEASKRVICKQVDIIGTVDKIRKRRTLPTLIVKGG